MSRYYDISVTPIGKTTPTRIWSSYPNGQNDPGALNVQLDLVSSTFAVPLNDGNVGNCTVTIEGVALADLLQAQNFANMSISIKGGMKTGLPLANASQSGLLLQGSIYQAFGNYVGTDQNINFVIVGGGSTQRNPGNFVFNWMQGQSLSDALANALNVVYPGYPRILNISENYASSQHQTSGFYRTLTDLANLVNSITQKISPNGLGVHITMLPSQTILAFDGSKYPSAIQLSFTDLIGQPKWINQNVMQFVTVMRADIQVGSIVKMPVGLQNIPGIVQTLAASLPVGNKYKTSFQGTFLITAVRHIGNFRDADGASWASIFEAAAQNVG